MCSINGNINQLIILIYFFIKLLLYQGYLNKINICIYNDNNKQ